MRGQTNVREAVTALLEQLAAENQSVPPLRVIRERIGGHGSMETISETVRNWKCARLQAVGSLPTEFDDKAGEEILNAIWQAVLPVMQKHIEGIRKAADDRVELEHNEVCKLTEAAAEVFAASDRKNVEIARLQEREQELQSELSHARGALEKAQETIASLRCEMDLLRKDRDSALAQAASAQASAETIRKLVPFLDPKHLTEHTPKTKK